ncbi:MAG: cold shock domain-containing protein CspD [Pseudomonadales bacterium]
MQKGVVKWFNNAKGYGFILPEADNGDIFAHYSAIEMDGYKTLKAGQKVSFETEDGPKGLHAINIQSDSDAEDSAAPSDSATETRANELAEDEAAEPRLEEMA